MRRFRVDWLDGSVQAAERVRDLAQVFLGAASLGMGVLGCHEWQRHRRDAGRVHHEPDPTRARRQFQRHLIMHQSAVWRTNPALSRNLKPPPLGGGAFTGL